MESKTLIIARFFSGFTFLIALLFCNSGWAQENEILELDLVSDSTATDSGFVWKNTYSYPDKRIDHIDFDYKRVTFFWVSYSYDRENKLSFIDYLRLNPEKSKNRNYKYKSIYSKSLSYYQNGNLKTVIHWERNKFDSIYEEYYENGNLELRHRYKNGKMNGSFTEYFEDGKLRIEGIYVSEKKTGYYRTYHANGNPQCLCNYDNNKRDSLNHFYYDNGQLKLTLDYDHDKYMNIIAYYSKSGEKLDPGTLKDGNGTYNYYSDEGKLQGYFIIKDGKSKKYKKVKS